MNRLVCSLIALGAFVSVAHAADPTTIKIGYLTRDEIKPTLSLVNLPTKDDGLAGARLAIEDNNTTGKFLNQRFTLEEVRLKDEEDPAAAASRLADQQVALCRRRSSARMLF